MDNPENITKKSYFKKTFTVLFRKFNPLNISLLLTFVFSLLLAKTAWLCDDSMITLRSVLNFTHGYGLVFNIGERAQSYTHPVWMLLLSCVSLITREVFITTIFISMIFSLIAYVIALYISRQSIFSLLVTGLSLIASKAFIDYSTSGLENPLSFLLFGILMLLLLEKTYSPAIRLTRVIFVGSLIFLCRMDYAVILAPIVSLLCLQTRSIKKSLLGMLVGGIPAFSWLLFSLIYYGTVFPNTYYAKLSTNIPKIQYIYQGLLYVYDSSLYDSFTLAAIVSATFYTIFFLKDNIRKSIAAGVILYCLYTINIGGDFMSGRYFAVPLYISIFLLSDLFAQLKAKSLIAVVMVAYFSCTSIISIGLPLSRVSHAHGINNEQAFYYGRGGNSTFSFGLLSPSRNYPDVTNWRRQSEPFAIDDVKIRCGLLGNHALSSKPNTHWIDPCGLTDPLLARLGIDKSIQAKDGNRFGWRIGHIKRDVPDGYAESIQSGQNLIEDPDIARFYDVIKVIVSDPIFSRKRLAYLLKFSRTKTFADFKNSSF